MPIHPTAIVNPAAGISPEADIGPYCIVGADVRVGARTRLMAHVFLEGKLEIGEDNIFYPYSSIGVAPQDLKYAGEASETRIGHRNKIREFVTINRGTTGGGMVTAIGSDNLLMAYVHVAHDVIITDHVILANNVTFAGHVYVGEYANIGGHAAFISFAASAGMPSSAATASSIRMSCRFQRPPSPAKSVSTEPTASGSSVAASMRIA